MSCPQIWNLEKEKDRKKEKVGQQASEAQRERELERERKNKGDIFCWRNNMKFCSGGEKILAATRVKIGTLRSEDGDGRESIAEKVNSRSFSLHRDYSKLLTLSNVGEPS